MRFAKTIDRRPMDDLARQRWRDWLPFAPDDQLTDTVMVSHWAYDPIRPVATSDWGSKFGRRIHWRLEPEEIAAARDALRRRVEAAGGRIVVGRVAVECRGDELGFVLA